MRATPPPMHDFSGTVDASRGRRRRAHRTTQRARDRRRRRDRDRSRRRRAVVDDGRRTYLHERLGWTSAARRARRRSTCPHPTRHWDARPPRRPHGGRAPGDGRGRARAPTGRRPSGCTSTTTPACCSRREVLGARRPGAAFGARSSTSTVGAPVAARRTPRRACTARTAETLDVGARRLRRAEHAVGLRARRRVRGTRRRRCCFYSDGAVHRVGVRAAGRARLGRAAERRHRRVERRRHAHAQLPRARAATCWCGSATASCTRA